MAKKRSTQASDSDDDRESYASVVSAAWQARSDFSRRDEILDLVDDLRFMRKAPSIPDAYKLTDAEVRNPLVYDMEQRLVGNLTLNPPIFRIPPPRPGPEGMKKSSHLEQGVKALVGKLERDSGTRLRYRYFDQAVHRGQGIIKATLRLDRWDTMPSRNDDEDDAAYVERVDNFKKSANTPLPVVWRIPDRRTVYPYPDEDGWHHVFEITERPVNSVIDAFTHRTGQLKGRVKSWMSHVGLPVPEDDTSFGQTKVTLIEYWDRERAIYWMLPGSGDPSTKGMVLHTFEHGYGRVPYFIGDGESNSSDDPNVSAVPAAYPMAYIAQMYDALMTMWMNTGYLTGFPTPQVISPPDAIEAPLSEDADREEDERVIEVGKIIDAGPGKKYEPLDFGKANTALTGMVGEIKGLMQAVSLPSIMQGIPPGSRTAGYAIAELANAAKAKYQTIVENGEMAWAEAINFTLYLLEKKVNQSVYLLSEQTDPKTTKKYQDYLELKPSDINGYYAVQVKIQPKNPMDRIQEGTFLANMQQQGLIDRARVIEEGLGYEQPDEVLDDIYVDDALQAPEVQQYMQQRAIQKAGLSGLIADAQAAQLLFTQQMQAAQQMAQGGPEGGPEGGANGLGAGLASPGAMMGAEAPQSGMEVPGLPAAPGMGMAQQQPQKQMQQPRMYRKKGGTGATDSRSGQTPRQPARPGIEGFRGRS